MQIQSINSLHKRIYSFFLADNADAVIDAGTDKVIFFHHATGKDAGFDLCAEDYIADRLVDLCEKRGLTKYRLAQLTGMSQTAIGSIISKESIPTIPTLEKLCSAFGITLAQFFSNEESHPNLTETQREILMIWDSLDVEERKVFMTMIRGLKK